MLLVQPQRPSGEHVVIWDSSQARRASVPPLRPFDRATCDALRDCAVKRANWRGTASVAGRLQPSTPVQFLPALG
ncbi:hypothetical protein PsYK624_109930 [Phanerochaete sordida]|uniref:Uncharacterized protein n=1 Tax=Phanerochaete sordida TaxID=48140 RepID=A0A9P3GEY7_9APHY|nr:hypothetical protein PsYK624_109930 [Phanerochaete sordida]